MRSFIVGTAGHIDHGKSALVRALTGTDPDRLKEEKERGITIDLGFAHLPLDDVVVSFIDVPGHERFVRNMLAGAHGIDAVLLVVAAGESVMPQTREHFHICRLLGIPRGLVALTKCDVVDSDSQALTEMEVQELVAGSFLEGAPVLRVSSRTGTGLPGLKAGLAALAEAAAPRSGEGMLRLPVDRSFTVRGFGTIVTGTVVAGALGTGEELEVLPAGTRARVRGIQVHSAVVDRVQAGSRAAVNLAGVEVRDVARGDVLVRPGTLRPTSMLDVALELLPDSKPLVQRSRVRVHLASAEVLARVRLLDRNEIEPGGSGLAQLRLERPAVAGRGDRLILRSYSPPLTIGGARVLDPAPPGRRKREASSERLALLGCADARLAAIAMIGEAGSGGIDAAVLAGRLTVPLSTLGALLADERSVVAFGRDPGRYVSADALARLSAAVRARLESLHEREPLRAAMTQEEIRGALFKWAAEGAFEHVMESLVRSRELRVSHGGVALSGHCVRLSPEEEKCHGVLLEMARAAGLAGVDLAGAASAAGEPTSLVERVCRVLLDEGLLCRVGDGLLLHRDALESLKLEVRTRWPPGSRLDVAGFKQLVGLSRKFVIPLLEYLDCERVTRRSGNDRLVLSK